MTKQLPNRQDPTHEEMNDFLIAQFPPDCGEDGFDGSPYAAAIYWFCADYHGGQFTNMYSVLSTSKYRPGILEKGLPSLSPVEEDMYYDLVNEYTWA